VAGVETPRELRLNATVTERGLVRSVSLSFVAVREGERHRVTRRLDYRDVNGTTVERPPWVDRALEE
jgi:hypothetical protein